MIPLLSLYHKDMAVIYASEQTLQSYVPAAGVLISERGKLNPTYSSRILFFLHRPGKPDESSDCCEIESGHLQDDDGLCF